jgi:hypothetical protein
MNMEARPSGGIATAVSRPWVLYTIREQPAPISLGVPGLAQLPQIWDMLVTLCGCVFSRARAASTNHTNSEATYPASYWSMLILQDCVGVSRDLMEATSEAFPHRLRIGEAGLPALAAA